MEIEEIIKDRKLEMIAESRSLGRERIGLANRLEQVNGLLLRLDVELEVLLELEAKLHPPTEEAQ